MNRYKCDDYGFVTSWGAFEETPNTFPDSSNIGLPYGQFKFKILEGCLVETAVPNFPPSKWHSWINGEWVDQRSLEDAKLEKRAKLNSERDYREILPIEVNAKSFDADKASLQRMQLFLASGLIGVPWTLADNTTMIVSKEEILAVVSSVALRANSLHTICKLLKSTVDNAITVSEVDNISWPV